MSLREKVVGEWMLLRYMYPYITFSKMKKVKEGGKKCGLEYSEMFSA